MSEKVRCESCYWFEIPEPNDYPNSGVCHYNTPDQEKRNEIPSVSKSDRCHHHSDLEPVINKATGRYWVFENFKEPLGFMRDGQFVSLEMLE